MTSYKYFYIIACLFIIIQHQTLTSKVEKYYINNIESEVILLQTRYCINNLNS
jgi:hypothetical protein